MPSDYHRRTAVAPPVPRADALHDLLTSAQALGQVAEELARCAELPPVVSIGGTETLLLANDNAVVRRVAAEWLRQFGYRVLASEAGRPALLAYRQHHPSIDLVLLDWPARGRSLRGTLAALRRIDPRARVLVCAALPEGRAAAALRSWGAAGLVAKPLCPAELARAVRQVLDAPA